MLIRADARAIPLCDESVNCVVTSPPYWGLRDYGTAKWEGGDPSCAQETARRDHVGEKQASNAGSSRDGQVSRGCRVCGARRVDSQLGLERTPEEYVAAMVAVFREVRRVLRKDGTAWVNLGDGYASNWGMGAKRASSWWSTASGELEGKGWGDVETAIPPNSFKKGRTDGLKVKDLVGIPWRVAFALQADGWWLRSDIVWSKPNPMPESVTDRPTRSHEYVFLLARAERYWYDAEAIAEPAIRVGDRPGGNYVGRNVTDHRVSRWMPENAIVPPFRNRRSVWTIPTEPYPGAHFATFPEALVEPCVLAGCPAGGVVLDPFCGTGTVVAVAQRLGRRGIGLDISQPYLVEQAKKRTAQGGLQLGI